MSDARSDQPGQPYTQPGQPYTQPGQPYAQPGQPYAQPGQPYGSGPYAPHDGGAPYSPPPARTSESLGRLALILAACAVGGGLLLQMLVQLLYPTIGYELVGQASSLLGFVVFAGAAAGLVLGIAALRRPGRHLLAAIAIGVAGNTLVGSIGSFLSSAFYNLGF